jgi:hypothetical protein
MLRRFLAVGTGQQDNSPVHVLLGQKRQTRHTLKPHNPFQNSKMRTLLLLTPIPLNLKLRQRNMMMVAVSHADLKNLRH